ncbi:hypothetical protein KC640_01430, partial [Candidatus Dojkabacteria bacterium]|nr:hypothetical protein [Candidatus Dojkabacteria bacterium]
TNLKNLFALNLDNGTEKFIPAVGYGGTEDLVNGSAYLDVGPVPVIKTLADNTEIAYQQFRSSDGAQYDGRWDSHLGEMVLNNNTISGMVAGNLRFVGLTSSQSKITDEQNPWTMAGNTLFYAHWGASEAHVIKDRSASKGSTSTNPITTTQIPAVIRRIQSCGTKNTTTHKVNCGGMTLFDDGRYWSGNGWWVYWNVLDPPTPSRGAYSEGILPRYTYASDGLIIVEGNGGDLFALTY